MKNRIVSIGGSTLSVREKLRRLEEFSFKDNQDFILRGVFWGVAIMALVISMINLKATADYRKLMKESIIGIDGNSLESAGIIDEDGTGFTEEIEKLLSEYLAEYIKTHEISEFFTEETKAAIAQDVSDRIINKLLETNKLNSIQEEQIRKLISEKISQIDYSSIEEQIKTEVESARADSSADVEALNEKLTSMIAGEIQKTISQLSSEISEGDATLNASLNILKQTMTKDMNDKYDELLTKINETNGRISDPDNQEYFQYGFDAESGAAGYYLNNQWKPF